MRVQCSSCQTTLEVPPGAELFACGSCGQTLTIETPQAQVVEVKAEAVYVGEAPDPGLLHPSYPDGSEHAALLPEQNIWMANTYSCCEEPLVCCYGTCCSLCMVCEIGLDVYEHVDEKNWEFCRDLCIAFVLSYYCGPCAVICCPQYCSICFNGHLLARFRNKYDMPLLPEGKGIIGTKGNLWCFADCWQMLPCCGPCTLCLMYRQMKHLHNESANQRPYNLQFIENSMGSRPGQQGNMA
mmetsp:Transcript_31400/g.76608  ORF Transcript_31400/g.76608 Transcript_31400/m.76608 type:complete len:240 (-) Transcript_31400:210-929(-)